MYSQGMFKLIENIFEVLGWVGQFFYEYSVGSSTICIALLAWEQTGRNSNSAMQV